ncbi:unnamed protein product [Nesidiocoris tenuis]|uniref:Pyridine nucleotide-disulfide oxidoreductase domain-containing protein 1 n=1 Tax=Nesidiocoris tenuis TaxID=355587 RepID=A0A6H5HQD9_9HEMI|nr:unnamed protein product [Nesidiocoris tenuis]
MVEATFVVIGGGIAGVSCAEGIAFLAPEEPVILISASPTVKKVTNVRNLTKMLSRFDVEEQPGRKVFESCPNVTVVHDTVTHLDHENNNLTLSSGTVVKYGKLCVCTGARPKLIAPDNPHVLGIRDTDSVVEFQRRLSSSRRVVVVGNGGIATELVHETSNVQIVWVIKDKHISATFVDPGAAEFFQEKLNKKKDDDDSPVVKRMKFSVDRGATSASSGAALGPDWHANVRLSGLSTDDVTVEKCCEVSHVHEGDDEWPVYVELTNGKRVGCDLIVSATGVQPNVEPFGAAGARIADVDGGLIVDWAMRTTLPNIYAAGDVCSADWQKAPHWFQMRLWTQARHMGTYAAKAMVYDNQSEPFLQDFAFELFTHVTKLFGMKVVLLGLFNGQTLNDEYEILLRMTRGQEYVKLILKNGRLQGAVLIGDTDLEEMCENLILNQLDLTPFGEDLLNPDIDIEDYFD